MLLQPKTLLHVDQLQFQWKDNLTFTPKVESFSFTVMENQIVGISAPSGFGKSTFADYLINLNITQDPPPYIILGTAALTAKHTSYLPQNAQDSLHPTFEIKKQIIRFQKELKLPAINWRKLTTTLRQLGFNNPSETLSKTPSELSGGQRQRICLLLLLLKDPDLLILDEPTAALDQSNALALFNFLKNWTTNEGKSVLCISHQTEWLEPFCNQMIKYNATENKSTTIQSPNNSESVIMFIENLQYSYSNQAVLKNTTLNIRKQQCYAITGSSGSGKSTLGKILGGHLTNYKGHLKSNEFPTEPSFADSITLDKWRSTFVYVPQNSYNLLSGANSFLDEVKWIYNQNKKPMPPMADWLNWCTILKIDPKKLDQNLSSLSGGERQKLNILQYLVRKPKMLILDEPTASLDESSKMAFLDFISQLINELEISILLLTHDPLLIASVNTEIKL